MPSTANTMLALGSTGDRVARAQLALNARTPDGPPLAIDGQFGPATAQRVRAFQQRHGLHADGVIGPETAGRLTVRGSDLQEVKSSVRGILATGNPNAGVVVRFEMEYARIEAELMPVAAAPAAVIVVVVVVALFAFCAAMIAIAAQAQNRQAADPLAREFERRMARLRQIMTENRPSDLLQRMVEEVVEGIEQTANWAVEQRRLCDEAHPLPPVNPLDPNGPRKCGDESRRVAELIASLRQKAEYIRRPYVYHFRYDDLLAGVLRNVRELVAAMFSLGRCQECRFLQIL